MRLLKWWEEFLRGEWEDPVHSREVLWEAGLKLYEASELSGVWVHETTPDLPLLRGEINDASCVRYTRGMAPKPRGALWLSRVLGDATPPRDTEWRRYFRGELGAPAGRVSGILYEVRFAPDALVVELDDTVLEVFGKLYPKHLFTFPWRGLARAGVAVVRAGSSPFFTPGWQFDSLAVLRGAAVDGYELLERGRCGADGSCVGGRAVGADEPEGFSLACRFSAGAVCPRRLLEAAGESGISWSRAGAASPVYVPRNQGLRQGGL